MATRAGAETTPPSTFGLQAYPRSIRCGGGNQRHLGLVSNVTDTNGTNATTLDYYPGDNYVDWVGVDGYNWGGSDWQTFQQVFAKIYPLLASKKKPIIIGEMASAEQGGDKGKWIDAMIPVLKAQYPLFKAVVWFDINKENDWRINSSTAALAAFSKMATDPYFNP